MIDITKAIPINEPGQPELTRAKVWRGLRMKANNALPFVPAITECEVVERRSELQFVREISLRGEKMRELITLEPETRVTFERLSGSVLGTILNEIEEDAAGGLDLRFSYRLTLTGAADGSEAERDYARTMQDDYMRAIDATLAAMRKAEMAEPSASVG